MKKTLPILALSLLVVACVPHDPDEVRPEPVATPVWQQPQRSQPVVVQQPASQPVVMVAPQEQPAQPTWWQKNKQQHVVKVVVPTCPCQDPNDPCPQCYQK